MGTLNDVVQCPCCGEAYGRDGLIVPPMETAGTTFDALRARAEKAEADNASLRATIRNLESRSVQAEAQAAALRGAIERVSACVKAATNGFAYPLGWATAESLVRVLDAALSSDAGRDLLRVVEVVQGHKCSESMKRDCAICAALAALDGGTG